jgi:cell division protein ZapE
MTLTPEERYRSDLAAGVIVADEAQAQAVDALQDVFDRLNQRRTEKKSFIAKLFNTKAKASVQGLYMWGGVGRGKTYLMDSFYDALDFKQKSRMHFNRFMQRVHADLTDLSGEKNPLDIVADRIASETLILCFDEFYVSDIGDAMLLGGLMQKLFDRGICLVATSNIAPKGLYENGLQRARFIPAIKAVEANTRVLNVDSGIDYRLRVLSQSELYFVGTHEAMSQEASEILQTLFSGFERR